MHASIPLSAQNITRLVQARESSGMSQGELAAKLQVSRTHFALCELGHRQPSRELLDRWCSALGLECEVETVVKIRRTP